MAGLLKLVLSFHHNQLPPQPLDGPLNPLLTDAPVHIPTEASALPADLAATSAFGIGGTNVHLVVGRAPASQAVPSQANDTCLLALSADCDAGWLALREAWRQRLAQGGDLGGLSETTWHGRAHSRWRATIAADSLQDAVEQLQHLHPTRTRGLPPRVLFAFTGQGAQHANMATELYEAFPSFRAALDRCAETLDPLLDVPLMEVLQDESLLQNTRYTQPALAAVEWSMVCLWRAWGVMAESVVGHSLGEWIAAATAGVLSPEDMLRAVAARGKLIGALPPGGAMAAVRGEPEEILGQIDNPSVSVAAINHTKEVVLSGDEDALLETLAALEARGIGARRLKVSHAFHSHLMEPALEALEEAFGTPEYQRPSIPFVSATTGSLETVAWTEPKHWRRAVREPVRLRRRSRPGRTQ